eukprot:c6532_g1_i1.p1 GENE.c6532_g1_i1~~c6532_g1_i1.p1  ORF type:complete len:295 (+),score=59.89 c6532_g1_i1:100-885(+)
MNDNELLEPYQKTRGYKQVFRACGRLLAGLQHIIDWKLGHNQHPEHFKYTIGALLHSVKTLSPEDRLTTISYFYVFVQSVLEGEKIKFRSNTGFKRMFKLGKEKCERRIHLCMEVMDFIIGHLKFNRHDHPSPSGPFPRLTAMDMPVFDLEEDISQQTTTTATPSPLASGGTVGGDSTAENRISSQGLSVLRQTITRSQQNRTSTGSYLDGQKMLELVVRWLHGRFVGSKHCVITDKYFNVEIKELNEVMARWIRVGASNK